MHLYTNVSNGSVLNTNNDDGGTIINSILWMRKWRLNLRRLNSQSATNWVGEVGNKGRTCGNPVCLALGPVPLYTDLPNGSTMGGIPGSTTACSGQGHSHSRVREAHAGVLVKATATLAALSIESVRTDFYAPLRTEGPTPSIH